MASGTPAIAKTTQVRRGGCLCYLNSTRLTQMVGRHILRVNTVKPQMAVREVPNEK